MPRALPIITAETAPLEVLGDGDARCYVRATEMLRLARARRDTRLRAEAAIETDETPLRGKSGVSSQTSDVDEAEQMDFSIMSDADALVNPIPKRGDDNELSEFPRAEQRSARLLSAPPYAPPALLGAAPLHPADLGLGQGPEPP